MKANQVQIYLFDGARQEVQQRVNKFLRTMPLGTGPVPDIVAIAYNYQGPEYDGRVPVEGSASHGILIAAHYPTINQMREERGFDPVSAQPGAEGIPIVPAEEFVRAMGGKAPTPPSPLDDPSASSGGGLFRRIKKLFGR